MGKRCIVHVPRTPTADWATSIWGVKDDQENNLLFFQGETLTPFARAESCPGTEGWQHTSILARYNFIIYFLTSGTNTSALRVMWILISISLSSPLAPSKTKSNVCVEKLENMPKGSKPKGLKGSPKSELEQSNVCKSYDLGGTGE